MIDGQALTRTPSKVGQIGHMLKWAGQGGWRIQTIIAPIT